MKPIQNKWKKIKAVQTVCIVLAVVFWVLFLLPVIADAAGQWGIRLWIAQNMWVMPLCFVLAVGFTLADWLIGFRVFEHSRREKKPIIHRKRKKK